MITREYAHGIRGAAISAALNTPPEDAYPDGLLQEQAGGEQRKRRRRRIGLIVLTPVILLIGFAVIGGSLARTLSPGGGLCMGVFYLGGAVILFALSAPVKRKAPPASLEAVAKDFYAHVGLTGAPRARDSFLHLAPDTMRATERETFTGAWEACRNDIISAVRYQDNVTCSGCGKHAHGLWATTNWYFDDAFMKGAKLLVTCPVCDTPYCNTCYVALPGRHVCSKCGHKLQELAPGAFKKGLRTFMEEPDMIWTAQLGAITMIPITDRVADVTTEVVYAIKYKQIVPSQAMMAINEVDLGERGQVVCRFHNKAVKIGETWRLLSAEPGTLQAPSPAAGSGEGAR